MPNDFGPIYAETDLSRFPVEPWSTATNLIFLFLIVYWSRKTRLDYRKHPLIVISLPILLVGWLSGTIYHATRSHSLWLVLDYMPIMILVLAAAIYLWALALNSLRIAFFLTLGPMFIFRIITHFYPFGDRIFISIGYSVLALTAMAPAVVHCLLKNRKSASWLLLAAGTFGIAIVSRQMDHSFGRHYLPMGTHFLWHIFGGISAFCLIRYLYETDRERDVTPVSMSVKTEASETLSEPGT